MNIVLLSGQSLTNKLWIEEVEKTFSTTFDTHVQYYDSWKKGESTVDVPLETERSLAYVLNLSSDYYLFAKSIGSVIFLNSLEKITRRPLGVLLVGVPFHMAKEKGFDFERLKEKVDFPVKVFQKESDPYCSYDDLKVIEGNKVSVHKYTVEGESIDTHHYENTEYLLEQMRGITSTHQ